MRPRHTGAARSRIAAGTLTLATTLTGVALAPAQAEIQGDQIPMTVVDRQLNYGQRLVVKGSLGADGASRPLVLEYRVGGSAGWQPVAETTSEKDGSYRFVANGVRRSGDVRVRPGTSNGASASSAGASVASAPNGIAVGAKLATSHSRLHVLAGRTASFKGVLAPARAGRTVRLQVRRGSRWHNLASTRTRANGRFALRYRAKHTMSAVVRVRFAGDTLNTSVSRRPGRLAVYRTGGASWYGPGFYGGHLACGGTLQPGTLGVANKTLPCGTKVTFRYHGRSITVPVIDRGPYVGGRDWDLTGATARRLGFSGTGTVWSTK